VIFSAAITPSAMEDISCTGGCILQGGFLQWSEGFTYSAAEDIFGSGGYILQW
jgi:hypothetical protein